MSITRETWAQCRADYLTGKGSLAAVATRHGLRVGTVEKRARSERWTELRREFEAAQLAKLIPLAPVVPPLAPVALDGTISPQWLAQRQESFYRENSALVDRVRSLLSKKLTDEKGDLGTDGLAKLTTALGALVDAESKLLGLNRHRGKQRPYRPPQPEPMPITETGAGQAP